MIYLITNQSFKENDDIKLSTIDDCLEYLNSLNIISVDTETTGMTPQKGAKLLTIQLGNINHQYIIDFTTVKDIKLKKLFKDKSKKFLFQNAKFDIRFFYQLGLYFNENIWDTYLAESILHNGNLTIKKNLDAIAQRYLGIEVSKGDRGLIHKEGLSYRVLEYCAKDIRYLEDIYKKQLDLATILDLTRAIDLDNLYVEVLAYIEHCGFRLDIEKWTKKIDKDLDTLKSKELELNKYILDNNINKFIDNTLFGNEVNINWNSSHQVIELFKMLNIPVEIDTLGEIKESVGAKNIIKYKKTYPLISIYIAFKQAQKNCSTYGVKFLKQVYKDRIYTNFTQLLTTGRTSCGGKDKVTNTENINLQNIPRDEFTRSCFIADEGNVLIDIDYDGQEAKVFANQCLDPVLLKMYAEGITDTHSYNAYNIFPYIREKYPIFNKDILKNIKEEFPKERYIAKTGGFAVQYGGGPKAIAENCNISLEEAKKFYNNFFNTFKNVKDYFNKKKTISKGNGYITMNAVTRRKFFISDEIPEYKVDKYCCNYPTQSTSADISKYAGILYFRHLRDNNLLDIIKIVNFAHDEYILEVPITLAETEAEIIKYCMEKAGDMFCKTIRLTATPCITKYWKH